MRLIGIDFETFFATDYTLSQMTTEEYVRDPRFEAHGAAVHEGDQTAWLRPRVQLPEYLASLRDAQRQGEVIAMLAHHAHFDGLILSHHFDFRPDIWLDTLSMARVCFDSGIRKGLGALCERLGIGVKSLPYDKFKGLYWDEMGAWLQQEVASGCMHDVYLTMQVFHRMLQGGPGVPYPFPASELPIVSLTVKMFTEPCLVGNVDKLGVAWQAERTAQKEAFQALGLGNMSEDAIGALLRKDEAFAELLRRLGVEPDMKTTAKGNEKYAFAKTDFFMQDLCTDEDEEVAVLAEARLKAHSNIYQSRIERYGDMANRGPMCVYLSYAAAHTRRWGGGDKTNWQNTPRPDPYRPEKGALRQSIEAPQ